MVYSSLKTSIIAIKNTELMLMVVRLIESGNKLLSENKLEKSELLKLTQNFPDEVRELLEKTNDDYYKFEFEIINKEGETLVENSRFFSLN